MLNPPSNRPTKLWCGALVAACLVYGCVTPAWAHSPYAIAEKDLALDNGSNVRLERFYGDGIIGYDPVRVQLRDPSGFILAYTPVGSSVATFCPQLERCWAFTFWPYSGLPQTWRLVPGAIDWQSRLTTDLGPDFDIEDTALAFTPTNSLVLGLFGTCLRMLQAWPLLALLLTIWFALSYAMRWLNYRHYRRTGRRLAVFSTLLGCLFLFVLMVSVLGFGALFQGLPVLPIIAVLLSAGLMRRLLERFLPPDWHWLRGRRGLQRLPIDPRVF
ncbi:MAG TPA: hypothetical protein VN229_23425 [Terriglobales bacterium]|nr:hypothetical protein [Terriglobales bacterium]